MLCFMHCFCAVSLLKVKSNVKMQISLVSLEISFYYLVKNLFVYFPGPFGVTAVSKNIAKCLCEF